METKKRTAYESLRLRHLKVKVKSLAAESTIIREEERKLMVPAKTEEGKQFRRQARASLYWHRVWELRRAARSNQLAYGFLKGHPYWVLESKCKEVPNWSEVERIASRFGGNSITLKAWLNSAKKYVEKQRDCNFTPSLCANEAIAV